MKNIFSKKNVIWVVVVASLATIAYVVYRHFKKDDDDTITAQLQIKK